ncbi:MAG: hypothetical protein ACUVSM_05800 [Armatimonadota bacterium]
MPAPRKRQNFNITPEQEAEITALKETLGASTTKDALLTAVRTTAALASEARKGKRIYLEDASGHRERLLLPQMETRQAEWKYLVARPHAWRRQLFVKGRRFSAFTVWMDMTANDLTPEETAQNWDLPLEAVREIILYCEQNMDLLRMEAEEERHRLLASGQSVDPASAA